MAKTRINKLAQTNDEPTKLTPQQVLFCQEYVKDLNGTQAAIRAGYSEKGARTQASVHLTNPLICVKIKELNDEKLNAVKVDANTILSELLKLATSDIRKLFDSKGALLPCELWPDDIARAVSSVQVDEIEEYEGGERHFVGYTKKVKLWNKNHALELLGKHLSLFIDKIEVSGNIELAERIAKARSRLKKKE